MMKPENISDALGQLSDEILEETGQVRNQPKTPRKRRWVWAAAACLCVIAAGAAVLPRLETGKDLPLQGNGSDLPLLEISMESGGMGFEGLLYHDFSEMENGNPWHEGMELDTLPVFRNGSYSTAGIPHGLSQEEMEDRARTAAEALDVDILELEYEQEDNTGSDVPPGTVTRVRAIADGLRIDAEGDGTVAIWFDDPRSLPEEYSFAYYDTTREEAYAVLDYLTGQYAELLNFQQPQKALFRDYNIYENFSLDYRVYDAAGDDTEDILNYSFRQADFAPDHKGKLDLIRLYDGLACAEKIGDYPLITLEEARTALLAGEYITTVPYDFPGEANLYGGELVYRGSRTEQVFIPYYRFYADVSEEFGANWDNDLRNYGAYYVPAVRHQYLKPGWQWDGSFN